ncbi:50S ribosomal protein L11 [Piptocephalis cylindrospora]|uniref:Large ribosomal subunit protein uL11m n=1 Tax=Piptocephalis cylindrospora TaxID=1907219 RepID=A0A4V1IY89_9FUNG|nr:50S ribosomal protein L11 [Piptocephalis cylindrospora]|eukprot:RKP13719.1 50S ribosomal protein L11 [Piptocephalis cylindrospora]
MSKKQAATSSLLKLVVAAGQASSSPPVGPALGQRGVKSIDFCKLFNDRTKDLVTGTPIPTLITIKPDRSFTFELRSPPTSFLLKRAAGITKGSGAAKRTSAGTVSLKHIYAIAQIKAKDPALTGVPLRSLASTIIGSAKSMGIDVIP